MTGVLQGGSFEDGAFRGSLKAYDYRCKISLTCFSIFSSYFVQSLRPNQHYEISMNANSNFSYLIMS